MAVDPTPLALFFFAFAFFVLVGGVSAPRASGERIATTALRHDELGARTPANRSNGKRGGGTPCAYSTSFASRVPAARTLPTRWTHRTRAAACRSSARPC